MLVTNRFFEAGTTYKLCVFSVEEGSEWSPPAGSQLIHTEPIMEEGAILGFYLWALVPDSKMSEAVGEHGE